MYLYIPKQLYFVKNNFFNLKYLQGFAPHPLLLRPKEVLRLKGVPLDIVLPQAKPTYGEKQKGYILA